MPTLTEAEIRGLRNAEPFELVDSVRIGPNMSKQSRGWYDTWSELGNQDQITFFSGRDSGAFGPWCNQLTERRDYATYVYHVGVEFHAPTVSRNWAQEPSDALAMPMLFTTELPQNLRVQFTVSGTDEILDLPAVDLPAGTGSTGSTTNDNGAGLVVPGGVGAPFRSNMWHFPVPLGLPTNSQFRLWGTLDPVLRAFYQQYKACPGFQAFPGCGDVEVLKACIYSIRVRLVVKRLVQLRGARSAA